MCLYIPKWARCCPDCPTEIQVLRKPYRTSYNIGETIDYTGLIVRGYENGEVWSNPDYPSGLIPKEDLILPKKYTGEDEITVAFLCDVRLTATFTLTPGRRILLTAPTVEEYACLQKLFWHVTPYTEMPDDIEFTAVIDGEEIPVFPDQGAFVSGDHENIVYGYIDEETGVLRWDTQDNKPVSLYVNTQDYLVSVYDVNYNRVFKAENGIAEIPEPQADNIIGWKKCGDTECRPIPRDWRFPVTQDEKIEFCYE